MQGNRQSGKRMRGRGRAKAQSVTTPGSSSNRNPLQKTSVHVKREKETFRSYKSQDIVMMFVGFVVKAVFSGSCWFCGKRRFFFFALCVIAGILKSTLFPAQKLWATIIFLLHHPSPHSETNRLSLKLLLSNIFFYIFFRFSLHFLLSIFPL